MDTEVIMNELREFLSDISSHDNGDVFDNDSSAQFQALEWLSEDPKLSEYSGFKKMQRYVMATVYYSTNGDNWKESGSWLTSADECEWFSGLSSTQDPCDSSGKLTNLDLRSNDLSGEIPPELHLLADLNRIHMPENFLYGRIPKELGNLSNVKRLQLTRNRLGGSIPNELSDMESLQVLGLGRNWLTGTIPEDIGRLTKLDTLGLERNRLSGTIPVSLAGIPEIRHIGIDHNFFSGNIPSSWSSAGGELEKIALNDNDFTGAIPPEWCGIDAYVSADCQEIDCPCCTQCCTDSETECQLV